MERKIWTTCAVVFAALIMSFSISTPSGAETWKMAIADATGSPQYETGKKFAEIIAQKTDGKYKVNLFHSSQLGNEPDTVHDAAMGTLDFSVVAINHLSPLSPTVGVLSLPYVIQSLDEAAAITQGKIGEELTENTIRDARVRILAWTYTGFRVLTNSKKPVTSLDDLKGLVIRVPKNEIMISTYKAWGINPSPMVWSELFSALQQGVVDGQDNPYATVNAMNFFEVQKYITPLHYLFSLEPLVMSEQVFQSQTPEMQNLLVEAGKQTSLHSQKYLAESEELIKKKLVEEKGMVITLPANDEKEWIEKATTAVWPKYYKSIGGKEKLEEVLKAVGRSL